MTDAEIMKALECHADIDIATCKVCAYDGVLRCGHQLCHDALDLINRQKAEIERLKKGWKADVIETSNIKAEAIKEFAERLKENTIDVDVSYGYGREHYTEAVAVIEIDNLVKEMAGEDNA